jgi:putative transposase
LTETQTPCEQILEPGKQPARVYARSLLCHWAIRSIGMTAVAESKLLGIGQSAATRAVYWGEAITAADNLKLVEGHNA